MMRVETSVHRRGALRRGARLVTVKGRSHAPIPQASSGTARGWAFVRVAVGLPGGFNRARIGPFGLRGDARGRCRSRRERIAKPATPRPVLRPLGTAHGQRCRTRRHLRGLPRTEHPPQPAGKLRRRIIGAVGSTRRRSARRRTGCGCSPAVSARRAGQQMAPGQRR